MKIYTKTGDGGETGLFGGKRVNKSNGRIAAFGHVDELNSLLSVCRAYNKNVFQEQILRKLQHELFVLGADLATPLDSPLKIKRIGKADVTQLEKWIDAIALKIKPLRNFILPGGNLLASHLHLARAVCRRAERGVVLLKTLESINEIALVYLNRLSDLLFMMGRYANKLENEKEEKWVSAQ